MADIFNSIQASNIPSNVFSLTHDVKLSTKVGQLTPCCVIDTIPGDRFTISGNAMVRLAPMIAPVMHRMDVYIHYFFVPNRILWPNWQDFITGGEDGENTDVHPFVEVNTDQTPPGSLADYMGLPTDLDTGPNRDYFINPMAFAAYQKIYDDYYRDENLIDRIDPQLTDGDNQAQLPLLGTLRNRAWSKDYFTSALPWTQRGPEALLPVGGTAPLEIFQTPTQPFTDNNGTPYPDQGTINWNVNPGQLTIEPTNDPGIIDVSQSHFVDLSQATAQSIIDLRRAFALQTWLEKNATGGARYIENIAVHFGVETSDKRLQRPEYIGGVSAPIKMSEVLQTSASSGQPTPQGTMAGHGISVGGSKKYSYFAEEHGYIMGIMSVLPKPAYQQGVEKHYRRFNKFDYAWPTFAHVGEQPIENLELYVTGDDQIDQGTFGYTPRYAEYKFKNNRVAGDFRTSLDFWHMGRKFANLPGLNEDFITCFPEEIDRIFAVQSGEDNLWCQVLNEVSVRRKLPVFGTPKIV